MNLNPIGPILNFITWLGKVLGLVFVHKAGKDSQKLKQAEQIIEEQEKNEKLEDANALKSNITILSELREEYARGKKR